MWDKIKAAAEAGVLTGVRWLIALSIVGLGLSWLAGDYAVTKQRALNGQRSFEQLQRILSAKPAPSPSPPPVGEKGGTGK